ncbi:TonB-dependent receptor [Sphingomonas donggukensis]|uniref:TonB-dependent receptor n=1 Tax=Sphingomonas donggukensis TaxID=2949093 RepID=A0ABY4TRR3_9SPHN|nr:TonB-dependent receptor [Sphingomonas donggukensis]URW75098.1 TonB-dependent receptor [Sphingomonas donggukensis]
MKGVLLAGTAAILAITTAGVAQAQQVKTGIPEAPSEGPQPSPQAASPDAATADAAADQSGDIIVTANKRSERLQSVAASITAVDDVALGAQAILTVREFSVISPTLNFQAADEARLFNFSIRGIGTESFSVGVEPSVATIIDGVVYTRPGAAFDGLGDIERVEVLNGPQGTLQGKNASAGAVSIITKRPNRERFEGRAEVGIAEYNEYTGQISVTGPINDSLAYRAFGYYRTRDGVVTNIATGKSVNNSEGYGFRGKLEFEPANGFNLLLTGDITYNKADCCAEPLRVAAASGNVTSAFTSTPIGPDNRQVNLNTLQEGYQKNRGVSLEGNFEIGTHTLTSLTAYRNYRDFAIRDRDGTNAPFTGVTAQQLFNATVPGISQADATARLDALLINPLSFACRNNVCGESNSLEKNDTFSQEVRLTSPGGQTIDYILGLFYYDSKVERDLTIAGVRSNIAGNVVFPTPTTVTVARDTAYVLADMVTKVHTINKAVFGNVDFKPFDGLTLTGGFRYLNETLRWDHDKVTGPNGDHIGTPAGINRDGAVAPGANPGTPQYDFQRRYSDNELIGKLVAKYQIARDILVYGSWARGYKGQAVDADLFLTAAGFAESPVDPEKSRAWEIGLKSQFWDRRITVNLTGYDTKFTGYQTTSSGTDGSGAPVLRSAGELFTKGIEGDISIRPIPGLSLAGNFLFADNKFGDLFINATTNLKGGDPLNAPETKYGFSGQYEFAAGGFDVSLAGNYSWTSKTLFTNLADANNEASIWRRPSFGVANMTLGVTSPDQRYKLTLYVKNLFDKHYVDGLRRISGSVGGAGAVAQSLPRDFDRYFGGTFAVQF